MENNGPEIDNNNSIDITKIPITANGFKWTFTSSLFI